MVDDIYPSTHGSATITIENNSSANDALLLYNQTATVTVNFPEPVNTYSQGVDNSTDCNSETGVVSNFTSADFNLDNATGTITSGPTVSSSGRIAGCLGTTWTATFTPTNDREVLSNTITLADGWTDQVGNPGFDNVTSVFEVETYRPRAALTIAVTGTSFASKPALRPGDNGTLTVSFTDLSPDPEVYDFSNADITAPYVNLSTMTTSDNITWSGAFTPVDNSTSGSGQGDSYDNVRFQLGTNYRDLKGNPGKQTYYSPYYVVDTKPPTVDHVILKDALGSVIQDTFTKNDGTYRCIPVDSNIQVVFDYIMDTSGSITTNASDTYCRGETLKVSSDNFSTLSSGSCVKFASPPAASNHDSGITNQKFTLDPVDNLSYYTTYQVRVETGVEDALENNMTSQYTHSNAFRTSAFPSSTPTSGVFVAVGQYGSNFRSIDNGTSWDNETCSFFGFDLNGVTYANNTFVAVGQGGKIVKSTDNASSWQITNTSGSQLNGIAFGGGTFDVVAGSSGYTYRSADNGSSWSNVVPPAGGNPYSYRRNLYGVGFGNSTFVAVGDNGKIVRSTNNGSSWSNVTTGTSPYTYGNNNLRGVTFGNNTFVAVGYTGKIIRSTNDGSSWDNVTAVNSNYLYGVTFGNNTFMAVGQSGTIVKSTDNGSSWSSSSSGTSNHLYGITFGNNTFMAVGQSGRIVKSTDNGSSWDNSTSGTSNILNGVAFGD